MEDGFQKMHVAVATAGFLVDFVHPPGGVGVHRRVHVAQLPLVGGQLAVGVHVPVAAEQQELVFGKFGVEPGQRQTVESQVPGRVPGVLPGIGHRDDVLIIQVLPAGAVAAGAALGRRGRQRGVAGQPLRHVVVIELLAPEHARECLALHVAGIGIGQPGLQFLIELVGLIQAQLHRLVEVGKGRGQARGG